MTFLMTFLCVHSWMKTRKVDRKPTFWAPNKIMLNNSEARPPSGTVTERKGRKQYWCINCSTFCGHVSGQRILNLYLLASEVEAWTEAGEVEVLPSIPACWVSS